MVDLQRQIFRIMNILLVKSITLTHILCVRGRNLEETWVRG